MIFVNLNKSTNFIDILYYTQIKVQLKSKY